MTQSPPAGIDTSNYLKHTHPNPMQRKLIDRFHQTIALKIASTAPLSFLDAGCGEGFVSHYLQERFPGLEITGFDFNPDSVAMAAATNPRADYSVANILGLPFEDSRFDLVGCFEVMEHLYEPEKALGELLRVTRRNVLLSVPHEPYFSLANAARAKNLDIRPRGSDPDHRQFWSRSAFGRFVGQQAEIEWIGGSFPWTIALLRKR